ncbi:VOC family protein [Roseovarius arcticus]|uniref:VOC family protein n=1 Tax=Roseovarius arcticus TaxID=2547404 RepID=UPI0011109835|nr:VOC family protein [Roseovarius arcticus]
MRVTDIFLSINARDFEAQTNWWTTLLGRGPDQSPMPNCREWELAPSVLFQVLNAPEGERAAVSLRIVGLTDEIERLRKAGIAVPDPQKVEGFDTLRWAALADPEGNDLNLLEGV